MKRALLYLTLACALAACDSLPRVPTWMGGGSDEKPKLPGQRYDVLPVGSSLQPDEMMKDVPVSLPPVMPNPEWAQHTGNFTASTSNLAAAGSLENSHSASIGEGEASEHAMVPRPVVASGLVFAMDAVGNISAHDAGNIDNVRWHSKGVSEEDEPEVLGGGLAYDAGRLYATSGRGMVAAFDAATGQPLWRKPMKIPFVSAPRIAGGKLFATTIDNQVYAINPLNGDALWNQRGMSESAGIMNSVSPSASGDTVVVPYSSGEVYAFSISTGKELWNDSLTADKRTQATSGFSGIGGDPIIDNDILFAVSSGGMISVMHLITGQHVWDRPVGSLNTPWIAGDYLYVMSSDNTLVCFIKYSGRIRWATKLRSYEDEDEKFDPIVWRGPVLMDGKLVLVSSDGEMLLVSAADGTIVGHREVAEGIVTAPVVANGILYLVSKDATLYSLQ